MILRRQQLFTENTLTVILPLLLRKSRRLLVRLARLWGVVLLANLLGTFLFAFFVARVDVFPPEVRQAFAATGMAHAGVSLGIVFVRTVFAGWSIALMVWLLPRAESSRVDHYYSHLSGGTGELQSHCCRLNYATISSYRISRIVTMCEVPQSEVEGVP